MIVNQIYQCLWQSLHFLFSLYKVCLWVRLRIIAFTLWSYDLCQTQAKRQQKEFELLKKCKKQLNKIPKHLNLIIGPEANDVNEEVFTRLFTYALYMNIECISFFDTRSICKSKSKSISLDKVKCPEGWRSKCLAERRALWYDLSKNVCNGSSQTNGHIPNSLNSCSKSANGHTTLKSLNGESKPLEIYQIAAKDNRPLIAQACRNLFRHKNTKEVQELIQKRSELTDRLDKELAEELQNLSEPELSIVFSETFSTFGTLPWHTRFTEFQCFPPGQRIDAESFAYILYKYSRCEQRWGK
ncbi:dehydrodolichyl diphosphate synthase complex subunit nus1 [Stomoxys calcitrans]|uniref:ditrans,polycis-polyprenyl diphosphate synthase [(2E,6E)-farnesyldiphosphate specific] n=1 Tax=Stomoxys calcitrans TaxID=35570 RepID=A0A1I8Q6X7_STOCA|nr:dehydrodolichyl diphosphate synthase complex subunit nus1 [Stomoxys calcitrans]XP_013107122.1 dehydrodolichyl diphosphate synthase complex subunit nus1 [Stomoxys calcitrans]